jgi:hypothetical protein
MRGGKDLALKMLPMLKPDTKVYSVELYEQSMTFYLQREVTLVDYGDELSFGLQQQPELFIPTLDGFTARWNAHTAAGEQAFALVSHHAYVKLQDRKLAMRVVTRDSRRIVITNL